MTQKITPFLWFDNNAEEALDFYAEIFKDSKISNITRYPKGGPGKAGSMMTGSIDILGQKLSVINGGPIFKFNEAISFVVDCENQEEVDYYWEKLTAGGSESQCAWLKDKFGLSWQIVPRQLIELLSNPDPLKASKVMQAMLGMKKIVIADLLAAAA